jgi:hypothetical protein
MNSTAISILAEEGIEGIDAEIALRRIQSELVSPSREARQRLAALGLVLEDLDPNLHRFAAVVRRLAEAGLGEDDAFTIFGRRGHAAAMVLVRAVDRLEALQHPQGGQGGLPQEPGDGAGG